MDVLTIKSSRDDCVLEFYDRLPEDRSSPINSFNVKVTRCDLFAAISVYAGYCTHPHPGEFFQSLADDWRGWEGERVWESLEGELKLITTNDRRGHIGIKGQLRSGVADQDWFVSAVVLVDAGHLDGIAADTEAFFGKVVSYHE